MAHCTKCGEKADKEDMYCRNCGYTLKDRESKTPKTKPEVTKEIKKAHKQESPKTKKWISLSPLGYGFGVLFILMGLTALGQTFIGGLMFIFIGLLLFPEIKISRGIKVLGIFIFFMVIVASTPDPPSRTSRIHNFKEEIELGESPVPIEKVELPKYEVTYAKGQPAGLLGFDYDIVVKNLEPFGVTYYVSAIIETSSGLLIRPLSGAPVKRVGATPADSDIQSSIVKVHVPPCEEQAIYFFFVLEDTNEYVIDEAYEISAEKDSLDESNLKSCPVTEP